jgi:predicted regulator of Ras-like GTPase activity (Roadblock/LC7/MglB family)
MDAAQALADLMEISSQVDEAVILGSDGEVLASTLPDEAAAAVAAAAVALVDAAPRGADLTQLEAATRDGSVFVVQDGEATIAATTGARPTAGLVFYDLKTCLRALAEPAEKPKRRSRKKADSATA